MKLTAFPYQSAFRRFTGCLHLAASLQITEQLGNLGKRYHASVRTTLERKTLFVVRRYLATYAVLLFKHQHIAAHLLQVKGSAQSSQSGTYHYYITFLHCYIGFENCLSL